VSRLQRQRPALLRALRRLGDGELVLASDFVEETERVAGVVNYYTQRNRDSGQKEFVLTLRALDPAGVEYLRDEWLKNVYDAIPDLITSFARFVERGCPAVARESRNRGMGLGSRDNGARDPTDVEPVAYGKAFFRDPHGNSCNILAYNQALEELGASRLQADPADFRARIRAGGTNNVNALAALSPHIVFGRKIAIVSVHQQLQPVRVPGVYFCVAVPRCNRLLKHAFVVVRRPGGVCVALDCSNSHPTLYSAASVAWILTWCSLRMVCLRA
jgi:hypothetical protein